MKFPGAVDVEGNGAEARMCKSNSRARVFASNSRARPSTEYQPVMGSQARSWGSRDSENSVGGAYPLSGVGWGLTGLVLPLVLPLVEVGANVFSLSVELLLLSAGVGYALWAPLGFF